MGNKDEYTTLHPSSASAITTKESVWWKNKLLIGILSGVSGILIVLAITGKFSNSPEATATLLREDTPLSQEKIDACYENRRVTIRDYTECTKKATDEMIPNVNEAAYFGAKCGVFSKVLQAKADTAGCGKLEFYYKLNKSQRADYNNKINEYSAQYSKEFGLTK